VQLQAGSDALVAFASVIATPLGGGTDCDIDVGAATTSQGDSFSSDASCGFGAGPGDIVSGGDPGVGALANNGGPTPTMLPQAGSPLIDQADCAAAPEAVPTDQRGVARPQGGACDIGAVEVEPSRYRSTRTSPADAGGYPPLARRRSSIARSNSSCDMCPEANA
jgi:hypothetical protein